MRKLSVMVSVVVLTALCSLVVLPDQAAAGRIEPNFESYLQAAGPDDMIPVMIRAKGTLVGNDLKKQLASAYKTRAARHTAAVTSLQATARATQPAIRGALESPQFAGRVDDIRSFWIDNVITAMMTPSAIAEIASRADVDEVQYLPNVEFYSSLEDRSGVSPAPADATEFDAEPGLRAIRADSVWAMGYTGKGRLVATIDTGVDGAHNFLKDKWRGNNGYSVQESWFYPLGNEPRPRFFPGLGKDRHGTLVMGILVAIQDSILRDDADLDTVGVAPDAQWITAAVIDILGANILEAMQWCADPDGDPNTETDVPDVVNNSWGSENWISGCSDVFWNAIDNLEAAGAVVIFAAGNEGHHGDQTIRNPGNRATTELNAFSVGMIDARVETFPIHPQSSLGPSDCDGVSIKPEVVAPGVQIHTTEPRGFMTRDGEGATGTSFAVPHVAGGVALMREYNPNATVDEIKQALIDGATDLGAPGPDNVYGHGLVNLKRSIELLPPNDQPAIYIKRDHYTRPAPGETTEMVLVLRSSGIPVNDVSVTVFSEDDRLTVINGTASFGDFASMGDTSGNSLSPFVLAVSSDAVEGERLAMRFEITGSGGYTRTSRGAVQVGPAQTAEVFTHNAGNFIMSIHALGMFGLHFQGIAPRFGGFGYAYGGDVTQSLFEGSFLVGIGPDKVSDNARDQGSFPDADFQLDPGGRLLIIEDGPKYAEETRAAFSDASAENPIGLFIVQRTFVINDPVHEDYLTVEYTIYNRSGQTVENLHAGMYFDWDFPWLSGSGDLGGFDLGSGVGWMVGDGTNLYRGIAVLTPPGATSYRYFLNDPEIYSPVGDPALEWDGFTNEEKWNAMTGGFQQTAPVLPQDGSHLIATGPFTIAANDSVQVAFAIIGATSQSDMIASAEAARLQYSTGTVAVQPGVLNFTAIVNGSDPAPKTFSLTNLTATQIVYDISHVPDWATVGPLSGTVLNGSSSLITVAPNIDTLELGTYTDSVVITTDADEFPEIVVSITLTVQQAQEATIKPNPFNPEDGPVLLRTSVASGTPLSANAAIYDIAGFKVRDIRSEEISVSAGVVEILWDGRNDEKIVASGIYFGHVKIDMASGPAVDKTYTIVLKK
jgi:hypothetical protein